MFTKKQTDEQLLIQLVAGKSSAFEEIYRRYSFKLYSIAYHQIGVQEEAEELVQDVFLDIWRRHNTLTIKELSVYLTVSIRNKVYDHIRSQINFRKFQEYIIYKEIYETFDTDEIVNFNDLSNAVEKILGQLPEKSAEIFRKSRFENQSVKDIAKSFDLSEKAVEYHITKSLKYLRENLRAYHQDN
jgi:RNA polymerase sigma-70 factor (family 1)